MGIDVQKNLIYFIYYSGKINHYHRLNLEYLRKYWSVFDGKKIVKIAVDAKYSVQSIVDLLPSGCEYQIVQNNRHYGESVHFINSINQVKGGMTFYAHCKGVSRPQMKGIDLWLDHLYKSNLVNPPILGRKLFSGTCGKLMPCPPYVPEPFHYSGSFYWFNTDEVRLRINYLTPNKYLTERFPAMMAKQDECIFNYPSFDKNLNYYLEDTWQSL